MNPVSVRLFDKNNSKRVTNHFMPCVVLKVNMEPTLLKFLKLLMKNFGQIKYHMRTAYL